MEGDVMGSGTNFLQSAQVEQLRGQLLCTVTTPEANILI